KYLKTVEQFRGPLRLVKVVVPVID
ncbi:hypothetical protein Tsp_03810, partial [Trichinella spiralis]